MMSSITSLSQLEIRSSSPSPFTPSASASGRSRSPPSPNTPGAGAGPAGNGESAFHDTVDLIKKGHLEAARKSLRAGPLRDELEEEIERDCDNLKDFLYAAQVSTPMRADESWLILKIIDEISPRSQDSIIGTGERLACKIVAAALRDRVSWPGRLP